MAGGGSGPRGRSEFRATVDVSGVTETQAMLRQIGLRAYQTLPLMEELKEVLYEASKERVGSAPWAPLADVTVARKASQGSNTSILRDEPRTIKGTATRRRDALYQALTTDGAPGQVKRATRTWAIFGVNTSGSLYYGRFVQNVKGTTRRLVAIDEGTAALIVERVGAWVRFGEGAGQSGYLTGSFPKP